VNKEQKALNAAAPSPEPASDVVQVPRELLERLIVSNSPYQFDPKTYWPAHKEASDLLNGGRDE
jgi:hypothetical protein